MHTYFLAFVFLFSSSAQAGYLGDVCDILFCSNPCVCLMPIHKRKRPTCCEKISNLCAKICVSEKLEKQDEELNNVGTPIDPTAYMMSNTMIDTNKEDK